MVYSSQFQCSADLLDEMCMLDEDDQLLCIACNKRFRNAGQWENHARSKKHLEAVRLGRVRITQPAATVDGARGREARVAGEVERPRVEYAEQLPTFAGRRRHVAGRARRVERVVIGRL